MKGDAIWKKYALTSQIHLEVPAAKKTFISNALKKH